MPPSEVTQSTTNRASPLASPMQATSLRTPVEVSAWTTAITAAPGWASITASGSSGRPHGASTRTTSAPWRRATSHMRSPNSPLTPTTTTSPGPTTAGLPVAPDDHAAPGPAHVADGRLRAGRAGAAHGERECVGRAEDGPQALVRLVQQGDELRVEVPEERPPQRQRHLGVRVA